MKLQPAPPLGRCGDEDRTVGLGSGWGWIWPAAGARNSAGPSQAVGAVVALRLCAYGGSGRGSHR
jgi:hypothetical protein